MTASSASRPLGVGAGALGAARVGRHDRQLRIVQPRQVIDDDRRREQVIDRNVKEPLNLRLVQIHRQHAVGAGRAQDIGDELGRNRHARLVLAVLARVAVIRDDGRDARRRRTAERVDHDQHLHDVLIDRRPGRLHDEHVGAADVLVDLKRDFRVGKPPQPRLARLDAEKRRNLSRQVGMGAAGKHFQLAEPDCHRGLTHHLQPRDLAGAEGFEPSNTGSKVPRLTAWPRPIMPVQVAPCSYRAPSRLTCKNLTSGVG